ncbi:MAG: MlaD family protein [Lentisphaeraceae bacterium]|nr:MlaD family protein [Lentisphaeraceae bacterium]
MIEANKLKLGLFVSLSTFMLITGLLILGLSDIFEQKYEFFTVFDESVQGLEKGAPIKYKGVTIGQVTKISVWKTRYVRVDMEYEPDAVFSSSIANETRQNKIMAVHEFLQDEVKEGLRCNIEISSLATGLKFIELNHIDHSRKLEVKVDIENKTGYVPAMKSLLSGAITNFDKTLTNIAKVDYEGIGIEAKTALINLNKILADPNIQKVLLNSNQMILDVSTTVKKLDGKIDELRLVELQKQIASIMKQTNDSLDKTFNNINTSLYGLTSQVNTSVGKFNTTMDLMQDEVKKAKIPETAAVARKAMDKTANAVDKVELEATAALKQAKVFLTDLHKMESDIHAAIKSIEAAGGSMAGLRGDFTATLKRFKVTLDSVKSFVDYLEKDPSSLIRGKAE